MPTCQANWEDEETNRRVSMRFAYHLADGHAAIEGVTPTRVSFLDESRSIVREIGVWTEKGRQLLAREAEANGWTRAMIAKIEAGEVHDIRHEEPVGEAAEIEPAMKA